jgi:hypothetical protein
MTTPTPIIPFDHSKYDAHLFGTQAQRVADCTQEQFDALKQHMTKVVSTKVPDRPFHYNDSAEHPLNPIALTFFRALPLPDTLDAQEAWLQKNGNYSDVLELSFSQTSPHAVMLIADMGVWILTDCELPWREAQRFDLCPSTCVVPLQDGSRVTRLYLDSLK